MAFRRAFTLIELLVVILMIAVMAGVIVPAYARFADKNRFQYEVRLVQDKFAEAREKAVENATAANVVYDPQSGTFTVEVTPQTPPTDQPVALTTGENVDNAAPTVIALPDSSPVTLGHSVEAANFITGGKSADTGGSNRKVVRFRSDGTCDGATLTLVSRDGYAANITLQPATGRAIVEDAPNNP